MLLEATRFVDTIARGTLQQFLYCLSNWTLVSTGTTKVCKMTVFHESCPLCLLLLFFNTEQFFRPTAACMTWELVL